MTAPIARRASTHRSRLLTRTAPLTSIGSGGAPLRGRGALPAHPSELRRRRAHGDDSTDVLELFVQDRYRVALLSEYGQEPLRGERLALGRRPERVEPDFWCTDRARELVGGGAQRLEVGDAGTKAARAEASTLLVPNRSVRPRLSFRSPRDGS